MYEALVPRRGQVWLIPTTPPLGSELVPIRSLDCTHRGQRRESRGKRRLMTRVYVLRTIVPARS